MNLVATRWWSTLFMPSCVLLACIAVGLFLAFRDWRKGRRPGEARLGCTLAAGGALLLHPASTPLVARTVTRAMESAHPPVDCATLAPADAIVVLGGAAHASVAPDGTVHVYALQASDRFETAMRAFGLGKAPLVAFGGGSTGVAGTPTEGQWNRDRAIARGVPADRALCGPAALYTSDESAGIAELLRARGVRRLIVCTSALHMPRALAKYGAQGFEVVALPSDFLTRGTAEGFSFALLIPRGLALPHVDLAAKELLGRALAP